MESICTEPKEVAKAVESKQDEIFIEINLGKKVLRIKAIGKIAWAVCAASLAAAIAFFIATPAATAALTPAGGGAAALAGMAFAAPAVAALGSAVVPAILIGVSAGGIGALTTLRDKYKVVEKTDKYIKLKRKKK